MPRLGEKLNEYGTPEATYRCSFCEEVYTITPAPKPSEDAPYEADGCMGPDCESHKPAPEIVRAKAIPNGDGTMRVATFGVIEGGRDAV